MLDAEKCRPIAEDQIVVVGGRLVPVLLFLCHCAFCVAVPPGFTSSTILVMLYDIDNLIDEATFTLEVN